ncbi:TIR domain-containing protein, partial [Acinetobacter baumannii]|uniref:TIR domain-containing protein n=1 Tax=Acinetobacter baumannii TaxID=470 RepID=UPI003C6D2EEC
RDTSKPETIKANLRERLKNAKQIILLGSKEAKRKGSDGSSFLAHEIKVILELKLPVVIANLGGSRDIVYDFIPKPLLNANYY